MADDELRHAERAWLANEGDQAALARHIEARYRAGLPVTHDLLDRQVHEPCRLDLPFPARVEIERSDGDREEIGQAPGGACGVQVPHHRALWVTPLGDAALDVPRLRESAVVQGLDLGTIASAEGLRAILTSLTGSALTRLELTLRGAETPGMVHLLADAPRLACLDLDIQEETVTPETLAPLTRAQHLSRLRLSTRRFAAGAIGALGLIPSLRELEIHEGRGESRALGDEVAELARAGSLAELRLIGAKLTLDDSALLEIVTRLPGLRCLTVPSCDITEVGAQALEGLCLEELTLISGRLGDGVARALAGHPLRILYLNARLSPSGASLLPTTLEELSCRVPAGEHCLEWLARLDRLRDLSLELTRETTDDQLAPLRRLAVERLSLEWAFRGVATSHALLHLQSVRTLRHLELDSLPDVEHVPTLASAASLQHLRFSSVRQLHDGLLQFLPPNLVRLEIDWCDEVSPSGLRVLAAARPELLILRDRQPVGP